MADKPAQESTYVLKVVKKFACAFDVRSFAHVASHTNLKCHLSGAQGQQLLHKMKLRRSGRRCRHLSKKQSRKNNRPKRRLMTC